MHVSHVPEEEIPAGGLWETRLGIQVETRSDRLGSLNLTYGHQGVMADLHLG